MNLETELCKRLKDLFTTLLPGVEIVGNWLPDAEMKGAEPYSSTRLDITVGGHRHETYSSPIAETVVNLDLSLSLDADVTLGETIAAHEKIGALLDEWHESIAAVKRDLTLSSTSQLSTLDSQLSTFNSQLLYTPVGLRVDDAGTLTLDRETKTRTLAHQFTIKGRIR